MQGADEGRSREKVSWASVNAADTSLEVRDEVAASSRAELKEVVMDHPSGPKPHRFISLVPAQCEFAQGGAPPSFRI